MTVRVVTDSASDMPLDLARDLGMTVVPANVHFGTEVFRDGVELTTDQFFDRLFNGPDFPTTSQPSVGEFAQAYSRTAEGADGIVSVHVSSKVSGTVNSATQGAQQAGLERPIEIVDSLQASMGTGLIALQAARAANAGASIDEVRQVADDAVGRCQTFALLDTLEYLLKGGRIGRARAMLGGLLKIKPIITIENGEVSDFAKERTRRKAVDRLRRAAESASPISSVAIMFSTSRDEADRLAESIRPMMTGDEEPMVIRFGPALGTYVGPNALGVSLLSAEG